MRARQPASDAAERLLSYKSCVAVFLVVAVLCVLTPIKEYYLASYVTKAFDEVRDEIVGRRLHNIEVVMSGVHYFDTFARPTLPLIDSETKSRLTRTVASTLPLPLLLARASVRRADLLAHLPEELLSTKVTLMEDVHAPLCGATSSDWETPPQRLFGHWFPSISHTFCRGSHAKFPRDRFFNSQENAPIDHALAGFGEVTLGLIAVVNMSEVYLRHFDDKQVIRKIMKTIQQGFLELPLDAYSSQVADAIVDEYSSGIALHKVISLLPGSFDRDHIALVDLLGIRDVLAFYVTPQQLTVGVNVNGEPAILAEVTHAPAAFFTTDFLINTVGMHLISTMHLAPFWDCAIRYTPMEKNLTLADVDGSLMRQCGQERARLLPLVAVNLMFLFQKQTRDYGKLDNTSHYTLGHRGIPMDGASNVAVLPVPETLAVSSPLLMMGSSSWTTSQVASRSTLTPYGYLFTPDCKALVDTVMKQGGRNVQKYQAYLGDGLGNCAFHDSQETSPQTLCREFMDAGDILFRALNGSLWTLPSCRLLVDPTSPASQSQSQSQQQTASVRQIEWFMADTTTLTRRIRIQDNTSRQIRTLLLLVNLVGATYYVAEYLRLLKSIWLFVHHSLYEPRFVFPRGSIFAAKPGSVLSENQENPKAPPAPAVVQVHRAVGLELRQLRYFDPTLGALQHPGTMALLYLGAVGALSNVFSLVCFANLSATSTHSNLVIVCQPAIPLASKTLLLTSVSSGYWVAQVALQTRTLADRLDHSASPYWHTNTLAVLVSSVVLHFMCKGAMDVVFQNVELRSDPHLYAILGGFLMSGLQAALFLAITYRCTLKKKPLHGGAATILPLHGQEKKETDKEQGRKRRSFRRHAKHNLVARERSFLVKWGASQLNGALHHCATPYIAQQLQSFHLRRVAMQTGSWPALGPALAMDTAMATSISVLPAPSDCWGQQESLLDQIEIFEFVMVHCAAGAARHLETVAWHPQPGSGKSELTTVKSLQKSTIVEY